MKKSVNGNISFPLVTVVIALLAMASYVFPAFIDIYTPWPNYRIFQGEWWRLLGMHIVHLNWMHITGNLLALIFIGGYIERKYGAFRMLLVFLLSNFCAMALEFNFGISIGGGMSGGTTGLLAYSILDKWPHKFNLRKTWAEWIMFISYFPLSILFNQTNIMSVAILAHFGGAMGGILLYLYFNTSIHQLYKFLVGMAFLVAMVFTFFAPNNRDWQFANGYLKEGRVERLDCLDFPVETQMGDQEVNLRIALEGMEKPFFIYWYDYSNKEWVYCCQDLRFLWAKELELIEFRDAEGNCITRLQAPVYDAEVFCYDLRIE